MTQEWEWLMGEATLRFWETVCLTQLGEIQWARDGTWRRAIDGRVHVLEAAVGGRMCSFEGRFSVPLEHACTRLSHLRLYVARPDGEPTEPSPPEPTVTHGPGRGGTDPSDSPPQTPAALQQVDCGPERDAHTQFKSL